MNSDEQDDFRLNSEDDVREMDWLTKRYKKKRFWNREPKHGSKLINQLMARKGYGQTNQATQLQRHWEEAVGNNLAERSSAGKIKAKRLEVTVENSSVLQELTFQKRKIIRKLQTSLKNETLTDLKFKVGPLH